MRILGIDEVGRGPLAGPLVVGAVILPDLWPEWVENLRDSKKLTAKKREALAEMILGDATTGLGWVFPAELDQIGISEALRLATRRAVEEVQGQGVPFHQIVIDGKVNFLSGTALESFVSTKVKADDLVKQVSAASIVAKVARDHYMYEAAKQYPGYGFEKHVGYGTKAHMEAIHRLGVCPEHRRSFEPIRTLTGYVLREMERKNTTRVGNSGEAAVCAYLARRGHRIVARNFKTKTCEIDIVSVLDDEIYFTEVKTRKTGNPFSNIDARKMQKMIFAEEVFMKARPEYRAYNPLLAAAAVDGDYNVIDWFPIR